MRVLRLLLADTPPEQSWLHLHQGRGGRDVEAGVRALAGWVTASGR
jgi:hypothetical protein